MEILEQKLLGSISGYDQFDIRYGPAVIFSGQIPGLDANFIQPKYDKTNPYKIIRQDGYVIDTAKNNNLDNYKKEFKDLDSVIDIMSEISGKTINPSDVLVMIVADGEGADEAQMNFIVTIDGRKNCLTLWSGSNNWSRKIYGLLEGGEADGNESLSRTFTVDQIKTDLYNRTVKDTFTTKIS